MRYLATFAVVSALASVGAVQGQTVRSHSSLRIPTPGIDQAEESASNASRRASPTELEVRSTTAGSASAPVDSRLVPAREASLVREFGSIDRPALVPLSDDAGEPDGREVSVRSVSASPTLTPISTSTVDSGVQYYGPSADAAVRTMNYATPASYGASVSPVASSPVVVQSNYSPSAGSSAVVGTGIAQTSFSAPVAGNCCGPAATSTVVTGMQPTFPSATFPSNAYPSATYPSNTVFAPPVADAASFPPSLAGSTIPGAGASGQVVPYLVNPVAVNIPAVPVDESRLKPIVPLRPTVPEESYAGRGILGQPELYVRGQHVRNVLRYITLW